MDNSPGHGSPQQSNHRKSKLGLVVAAVLLAGAIIGIVADLETLGFKFRIWEGDEPTPTTTQSPPAEVGHPLNVYAYCRYKGFATSRPEEELRTVSDWTCVRADGSAEAITINGRLSWNEACQYQYGPAVVATNTDPQRQWGSVRCVRG